MNYKQLLSFVKVIEEGGFTQAAKALYMTQPAISWQIKSLEEDLGLQLLERKERIIQTTDAGKLFYDHAKKIVKRYEDVLDEIEQFKGMERGNLFLGASTIPGEYILPCYIGLFKRLYEGINIKMQIRDTGAIINLLQKDEIHLGIVGAKVKEAKIDSVPFLHDEIILIAASEHDLAAQAKVSLADVTKHSFIMREAGSGTQMVIDSKLGEKDINTQNLEVVMELGSTSSVITAVEAGLGISWVSKYSVQNSLQLGKVKQIDIDDFKIERDFYIISNNKRTLSPIVSAFYDFLLEKENSKNFFGN